MKPAPFSYYPAATLVDALDRLAVTDPPKILAGGQSLVPMLNLRLAPAESILDISRMRELREIKETGASICYGALTTHATFEDGGLPDCSNGLMRYAAGRIAYRAVRTRGTIGGSLALADPAADWLTVVIALGATIHVSSSRGARSVAAQEFVVGPYLTDLGEDELIVSVEVPRRPADERWGYYKVAVKTGEYADSLAVAICDRNRSSARIVLGATDGAPILMVKTAQALADADEAALAPAIAEDLVSSGREFSSAKQIQHTTTVQRAIAGVFKS